MAVGTGTYGAFLCGLLINSYDQQFTHAKLQDGATVVSNTVAIAFDTVNWTDQELVMTAAIVFTISSACTVDTLILQDSSGTKKAEITLTDVVYATPTYYTLSELVIYVT